MPLSRCAAIPLERRGISFYLEIATQKNWRSGTRDLDPERLCGVQAMVHFLTIRFRDVDVRADSAPDGLPGSGPDWATNRGQHLAVFIARPRGWGGMGEVDPGFGTG